MMGRLKPEHRDLLNPFGEIFGGMNEQIFDMSQDDLEKLSAAADAVDTGNCWCMIYDAAKWLRVQIDDEFLRRKDMAAAQRSHKENAVTPTED
jgi:hypothetical protein